MTYYCLRSGPGDPEVVNVCVRSFIRHNVEIDDATGWVGGWWWWKVATEFSVSSRQKLKF